ncbi:TIR domain-containing protein [Azospirillum sp. TSO22-1]|uniref:TIR domain-containing protein n=1 Tax=Azospirillum sp. TSO22-1 TaxID=716789 RepID=UPI000D64ADE2|nr:TIR domain-containing protein [Azospirillum sp. TSO22-1]
MTHPKYEVALSFAGEQRHYADRLARSLQARGVSVFYDGFERARLWGRDLAEEFHGIYSERAKRVVMLVSEQYITKMWCNHERRSATSKYLQSSDSYILPVRFDNAWPPGLPSTLAWEDAQRITPEQLATLIYEHLGIDVLASKASNVPPPHMSSTLGVVAFDYHSHNGCYVIGQEQIEFETKWSTAGADSIHVYNDPPSINGVAIALGFDDIGNIADASVFDFTSRARTPRIDEIVILRNRHGFYAALKILEIKLRSSKEPALLRFSYIILDDGSATFTSWAFLD